MIDVIIILIYIMLALAVGSVVWSLYNSWRKRSKTIPEEQLASRTSLIVAALTVAVILVSVLFSSATPLRIAGKMYAESLWLRMADVCMISIFLLLLILVAAAFVMHLSGSTKKSHK